MKHFSRLLSLSLGILILASLLPSCNEAQEPSEDLRVHLLQSLGDEVILPTYKDLQAQTLTLDEKLQDLCEAPSEETLKKAREAWWNTRGVWKRSENLAFGPHTERPLRIGPKMDSWPIRESSIKTTLAMEGTLTLSELGTNSRGLPVLEYFLYAQGDETLAELQGPEGTRRCIYLLALGTDLNLLSTQMLNAWDPDKDNFLAELTEAGAGSEHYSDLQLSLGEVVNRMAFTLENIRFDKLDGPLGKKAQDVPQPLLMESPYSGRALEDIRDNLLGIAAIYHGNYPGHTEGTGLKAYLQSRGRNFDAAFDQRHQAIMDELDKLGDLRQAIEDDRQGVEDLNDALHQLQILIETDILGAMGLNRDFNDRDGD